MSDRILTGRVVEYKKGYYKIDCPDAPPHLTPLFLVGWQCRGAKVGDTVRLRYEVTASSGLWNVFEVLKGN